MKARFIDKKDIQAVDVPGIMRENGIEYGTIETVDWPSVYPYAPKTQFAVAHNDEALLIHFKTAEEGLRAFVTEDNGEVWTDACVETFFAPDGDDRYYNLECNCIGRLLLGFGTGRSDRVPSTQENLNRILRWTSLGPEVRGEVKEMTEWQVALVVPFGVFHQHDIKSLRGVSAKANFYKCGGSGALEHYLSWNPIKTDNPDFHRPEFFGEIEFE